MAGEVECKACMTKNKPGAILCENCGDPLEVQVGTGVAMAVSPTPVAAASGIQGRACVLVQGGSKVADKEFELPQDDFEFLVGRNDLDQGIIPDVDLTKFAAKVTIGADVGYTVSRKQATISRRMGRLYLKATGSAKTLIRPAGKTDWQEVKKDEEVELAITARFRFGGSEGYVIFEVV